MTKPKNDRAYHCFLITIAVLALICVVVGLSMDEESLPRKAQASHGVDVLIP
ncbi:MAG: hypothetical protein WCJ29_01220 [bacterium]